ncbi:MAG: M14 family zinc carboxypeptidase [Candidatus Neomarinimicrobiota bacterium]
MKRYVNFSFDRRQLGDNLHPPMNRIIRILFFLIFCGSIVAGGELYQSVRIADPSPELAERLLRLGIPLDEMTVKPGVYWEMVLPERQVRDLDQAGIAYRIIVDDVARLIRDRAAAVPRAMQPGSMLGYYTYAEVLARIDTLQAHFPALVSQRDSIGKTTQGRPIWAFKISDNPQIDEPEPEVLYTGLIHAREPIGMMNLLYFAEYLCENYSIDPVATYLVQGREMWFVPVVNPDGYLYNQSVWSNDPDHDPGMHRKNRRDTGCDDSSEWGVDLNRNFSYDWGVHSSSTDPCSELYCGLAAFSEPETQALRNFILNHSFSNALHYHAFGNVIVHSYGDDSLPPEPDLTTLREIGSELARFNGYAVGIGAEIGMYKVSGDAVDWSYGVAGLISYTTEIGASSDYFWPAPDRILPLCRDQLHSNLVFAQVAGADYTICNIEPTDLRPRAPAMVNLDLKIQNRGLWDSDGVVTIGLKALNQHCTPTPGGPTATALGARQDYLLPLQLAIDPQIPDGTVTGVVVSLRDASSFARTDTITFVVGEYYPYFSDDAEFGPGRWSASAGWDVSTQARTGQFAFSDSPLGNYSANATALFTLRGALDFSRLAQPFVTFQARWQVEKDWDFVRFQASRDSSTWISLAGEHTVYGSGLGRQRSGEPGWEGSQEEWIQETIDLAAFAGAKQVFLRFILTSDNEADYDGFSFDDFNLYYYPGCRPGDLVLDGTINIQDLLMLIDIMEKAPEIPPSRFKAGDMNRDGQLNETDIQLLVAAIGGE